MCVGCYSQVSAVPYDPSAEAVAEPGLLEAMVDTGGASPPKAAFAHATADTAAALHSSTAGISHPVVVRYLGTRDRDAWWAIQWWYGTWGQETGMHGGERESGGTVPGCKRVAPPRPPPCAPPCPPASLLTWYACSPPPPSGVRSAAGLKRWAVVLPGFQDARTLAMWLPSARRPGAGGTSIASTASDIAPGTLPGCCWWGWACISAAAWQQSG